MGAYKPLLPFGDRTIIETCLLNFSRAGINNFIVVLSAHKAGEVQARLQHLQVSFAVNEDAGSEMSASIARGVEQLPSDTKAFFIALADQPAVSPLVIEKLLDERKRTRARIVAPEYGGRGGHPVLIDASLREELLHLNSERGLRALFDAHQDEVRRVAVDTPYVLRDVDTWEDYRALHTEVFGAPPSISAPPK
jgi:molybdenum cofactor cytidylyltransferase